MSKIWEPKTSAITEAGDLKKHTWEKPFRILRLHEVFLQDNEQKKVVTVVEKGIQAKSFSKQTVTKQRENKGNVYGEESNYSINAKGLSNLLKEEGKVIAYFLLKEKKNHTDKRMKTLHMTSFALNATIMDM